MAVAMLPGQVVADASVAVCAAPFAGRVPGQALGKARVSAPPPSEGAPAAADVVLYPVGGHARKHARSYQALSVTEEAAHSAAGGSAAAASHKGGWARGGGRLAEKCDEEDDVELEMQPMLRLHVVDEGAHVMNAGGWQEAYAIDGVAGRDRAGNPVPPYPALEGYAMEAGGGAEPDRVGHHTLPNPGPEVGRGVLAGGGDSARREEASGSGAELRDGAEGRGGEGTRVRKSICSYRTRCPCGLLLLGVRGQRGAACALLHRAWRWCARLCMCECMHGCNVGQALSAGVFT